MARRSVTLIIVAAGLAGLIVLFLPPALQYRYTLKACFQNASGLRVNAPVRIAGVDVGVVSRIAARPDQKDCPTDTELAIRTADKLLVPDDAVARIEAAGVLGPEFVEIDATRALGPPLKDHGVLHTEAPRETNASTVQELSKMLEKMIEKCGQVQTSEPAKPGLPASEQKK